MDMKNSMFYCIVGFFLFIGCRSKESHFLTDSEYRDRVHSDFEARKIQAVGRNDALFSVLGQPDLTMEEREALEFLYAYMPLMDLADYTGDYFLKQVRAAFTARDYFSWGKNIPEDIFRHFVLVYRVNNENLDSARTVFFEELKDRVKDMTMAQAALEVNHWCHEKVTYRATDARTSASLALQRTSWGRCGEESTFTATALRAVGIPARQCYTPRWAHTDDNHAWVEVWIDGKWHYIGACEPEPELDVAWFTGPAKRAMMVHTNVFGIYTGPEEKNLESPLYSKINVLSNYADVRKVGVKVVDAEGKPVEGAKTEFKVFNYAQFYPIAESSTRGDGTTSIISGNGDLWVWASKNNVYGCAKSSPTDNEVVIQLNRKGGETYEETFELVPPKEQKIRELEPEKIANNTKRLLHEDSIRNAYMSTFISKQKAEEFADGLNLSKEDTWKYLNLSQGNWQDIQQFIERNATNCDLFPYLGALSEKDLRDTPFDVLESHFKSGYTYGIKEGTPKDYVASYILSPRIANELIRPWRNYFQKTFDNSTADYVKTNVNEIVQHLKERININDSENYYNCPLSPQGVYDLKVADSRSRDILFVALCRSAGIAARLEPSTSRPQYFDGKWMNAGFEETVKGVEPQATVIFANCKDNLIKPEYFTHYSLARYKDGDFVPLNFRNDPTLKSLPAKVNVDAGYYRLSIGSRANDGSVTIQNKYFALAENEQKSLEIKLPETQGKITIKGIIDMNTKVKLKSNEEVSLKDLSKGKGVILCFADPDKEPTKHVLQDLPSNTPDLNNWGGGLLFLVPDDKLTKAFDETVYKGLPNNTKWGIDENRTLLNNAARTLQLDFSNNFPLIILLSNNGGILFSSEGYRIGIGENIIKTIHMQ